ncbi:GspE/PulE family protein [Pseudomonas sp.]|uniref:GspE/PulE family protein n=1 Tax=Pseudomonas sp. TaxID=306 RepID=UPI002912AF2B|nr:ATPase, T2SS/T4P/T4SS family [Pseudomonas sp.]MDU4254439.1 ATPase, T2SS/T4P/T4SS family [Pseudomonas sp.]
MTAAENNTVFELVKSWGFGSVVNDQLLEHAHHVVTLYRKKVGVILAELGIATEEYVESLMADMPQHKKTLEYLTEAGIKGLNGQVDRILAIQNAVAYVSRGIPQLTSGIPHLPKERLTAIQPELNKWGILPMVCGGGFVLLFGDFQKLMQFKSLGKTDRLCSPLFIALAEVANDTPEKVVLKLALASNSVHLEYQQMLTDGADAAGNGDDGPQIISQIEAESDPIIQKVVSILNEAIHQGTNDVAIIPDRKSGAGRVFFRKFQRLYFSKFHLTSEERNSVTRVLLGKSKANPSGSRLRHPADGNLNFDGKLGQAFLRLSFIPLEESQFPSTSVSMRVLPRTAKHIEMQDLNISPELQAELGYFVTRKSGLFVVCGPTGSGKSTTIAAMLGEHHKKYGDSLKRVSVEQPVERILPGVLHIDVSQHHYIEAERASDTDNFGMALRAILRHDPDVVFVGEVRDKESCMVSIDASNTGHLVLTSTHANDPILGYRRLASFLDQDRRFDLVNVLEGILAQRLVTTVCPVCSTKEPMDDSARATLERYAKSRGIVLGEYELPTTHIVRNKEGCDKCIDGYDGMLPVFGLLTMNPTVRELLLSPRESDWMKAQAASDSKFTLFNDAFKLFQSARIDLDAVML